MKFLGRIVAGLFGVLLFLVFPGLGWAVGEHNLLLIPSGGQYEGGSTQNNFYNVNIKLKYSDNSEYDGLLYLHTYSTGSNEYKCTRIYKDEFDLYRGTVYPGTGMVGSDTVSYHFSTSDSSNFFHCPMGGSSSFGTFGYFGVNFGDVTDWGGLGSRVGLVDSSLAGSRVTDVSAPLGRGYYYNREVDVDNIIPFSVVGVSKVRIYGVPHLAGYSISLVNYNTGLSVSTVGSYGYLWQGYNGQQYYHELKVSDVVFNEFGFATLGYGNMFFILDNGQGGGGSVPAVPSISGSLFVSVLADGRSVSISGHMDNWATTELVRVRARYDSVSGPLVYEKNLSMDMLDSNGNFVLPNITFPVTGVRNLRVSLARYSPSLKVLDSKIVQLTPESEPVYARFDFPEVGFKTSSGLLDVKGQIIYEGDYDKAVVKVMGSDTGGSGGARWNIDNVVLVDSGYSLLDDYGRFEVPVNITGKNGDVLIVSVELSKNGVVFGSTRVIGSYGIGSSVPGLPDDAGLLDTILYYIQLPFVMINTFVKNVNESFQSIMGTVEGVSDLIKVTFSFMPEGFQNVLFIGVTFFVLMSMIRVIRG